MFQEILDENTAAPIMADIDLVQKVSDSIGVDSNQ